MAEQYAAKAKELQEQKEHEVGKCSSAFMGIVP